MKLALQRLLPLLLLLLKGFLKRLTTVKTTIPAASFQLVVLEGESFQLARTTFIACSITPAS